MTYVPYAKMRDRAIERAAAQPDSRSLIEKIQYKNNAEKIAEQYFFYWVAIGCITGLLLTPILVSFEDNLAKSRADGKEARENQNRQRAFENQMSEVQKQNEAESRLSKAAQTKHEVIMRLGTIDQYLRVLGTETDASRRTVALQAAHSEMTTLAAKFASGELSDSVVNDSTVRGQAVETSRDLARLGLSEDRLSRDLTRLFRLTAREES